MNRPPEPSYTAPTPNHKEITPPQSAEIFLAMEELRRAVWRATKEARRITQAAQQPPQV